MSTNGASAAPAESVSQSHTLLHDLHTHSVQFYQDDAFLLDALARLFGAAIGAGEAVIAIATPEHLEGIRERLIARGLNITEIRKQGRYLPLDAAELLSQIMKDGRLDAARFTALAGSYVDQAKAKSESRPPRVLMFGEMVGLLVAQGNGEGAVELERLWNRLVRTHSFSLHCAYSMSGFPRSEDAELFQKVCDEHFSVIPDGHEGLDGNGEGRLREIAQLQQRAQALDHEKTQRQGQEHFRLFVENVREYALFLLDTEGRITSWNRGAERIKGYKAPEVLGKHFSIFYSPQDIRAGRPRHGLEKAAAEGQWTDEGWRLRKDGSKFWATVVITALRDENGVLQGFAKITRDLTERRRAEESLHELTTRLLSIRDDERRRLARELHDSTAQLLTALSLNLSVVERQGRFATDSPASNALAECFALAEQSSQELRNFSYLLHPPLLDEAGLAPALQWYVDGFARRSQIEVRLDIPEELGRLPRNIEMALFRVVQECLTNVYRHSGSRTASVRVKKSRSGVYLRVRDAGRGIPKQSPESRPLVGVGLPGMKERVLQLGGRMTIRPGQPGTIVEVALPLAPRHDEEKLAAVSVPTY